MKTADNKGFSKSDLAQKRLFTRPSSLKSTVKPVIKKRKRGQGGIDPIQLSGFGSPGHR